MTRLSVNVNKIATLRNARGGKNPDIIQVVQDCEKFGSQGITVHPRPDERHITHEDVYNIAKVTKTDYNIEGYPDDRFLKIIDDIRPEQVTLVPDAPDVQYAVCAALSAKMNGKNSKSIVTYLKRLPQQEFAAFVIKDAMNRTEDLKKELKRDDAVREWIMSIGKHLIL